MKGNPSQLGRRGDEGSEQCQEKEEGSLVEEAAGRVQPPPGPSSSGSVTGSPLGHHPWTLTLGCQQHLQESHITDPAVCSPQLCLSVPTWHHLLVV